MIDIWMVITTHTFDQFLDIPGKETALLLYLFYYKHAKLQQTNKPWATIDFCAKGLNLSAPTIRKAKKTLIKMGLIEDMHASGRNTKAYIKIKYITGSQRAEDIFCTTKSLHYKNFEGKCLKNKKRNALSKKSSNDDYNAPDGTYKRKTPKIIKKKKAPDNKSKYALNVIDYRNYNEIKSHGATNHRSDSKAELDSLDKLHALFSKSCRNPYYAVYVPEQYIDFEWDMDELIETFKFQLQYARSYNMNPIKSIGKFILSEGYNGSKSWSPLLHWHQKKNKTAKGELTEEGKKFLASLKRAKIDKLEDLESSIINKVSKSFYTVSEKYELMDGSERNMSYPFGMIDCLSKFIKEKTNKFNFKLVYITKNTFVDEFLETAIKRNIIKKRKGRRSVN